MSAFIRAQTPAHLTIIMFLVAAAAPVKGETKSPDLGEAIYMRGCIVCHGDDGSGAMPGIPDLGGESSVLSKPDAELLSNIMNGFESEVSTMPMPPKGGDDELTQAEAKLVLEYMRRAFQGLRAN